MSERPDGYNYQVNWAAFPAETLQRWANDLNKWKWPDDMPGKPAGFDDMPNTLRYTDFCTGTITKSFFINYPLKKITEFIGEREFLRWHHLNNLGRTDEEFEKWFSTKRTLGFEEIDQTAAIDTVSEND